jgi:ferrochelatase
MTGILLVNLGSPASPAVDDVRRYLDEFLHDPNVIDYPALVRSAIVDGIILRVRPKKSAAAYASIWWPQGSPLVVITQRLAEKVRQTLANPVAVAMRYGQPSIQAGLEQLALASCSDVVVVPLYPQYAMSTTKTVMDEVHRCNRDQQWGLQIRMVEPFFDNPIYQSCLVSSIRRGLPHDVDHVLLSYHGLPERHLRKTDPTGAHCMRSGDCCSIASMAHATCYRHQCLETSNAIIKGLGMSPTSVTTTFQSRLGLDRWLRPYTADTVVHLARSGVRSLAVVCPAFVADCLETLEEIGEGVKHQFLEAGGTSFTLIPCLNDDDEWANVLSSLIANHLPTR